MLAAALGAVGETAVLREQVVAADGVGVFDSKPVGPSGKAFLTQLDAEPWMIFKDSPHPEEAAKFGELNDGTPCPAAASTGSSARTERARRRRSG